MLPSVRRDVEFQAPTSTIITPEQVQFYDILESIAPELVSEDHRDVRPSLLHGVCVFHPGDFVCV